LTLWTSSEAESSAAEQSTSGAATATKEGEPAPTEPTAEASAE